MQYSHSYMGITPWLEHFRSLFAVPYAHQVWEAVKETEKEKSMLVGVMTGASGKEAA